MSQDGMDAPDSLGRFWDDLVTGSSNSAEANRDFLEMIRDLEKRTATPPPPPDLAARTWTRITGGSLPLAPYVPTGAIGLNGHRSWEVAPTRVTTRWVAVADLVRQLAIAIMAGFVGGFVTGLWARVVMRLAGILTSDSNRGLLTENDAAVGQMTLSGTLSIAVTGAFMGAFAGLLYVAVRRWLPGNVWQRSLAFGGLLLAVFGFIVMDPGNPDYRLFGPAWMNIGTFSLAYIVYGLVTGVTAEALLRRMPRPGVPGRARWKNVATNVLLIPFAAVGVLGMLVGGLGVAGLSGILFVALIAFARLPAVRFAARLRLASFLPRPELAGLAAMAAPGLIGCFLTARSIVEIIVG